MTSIIVSIITGLATIIGTIITCYTSSKKTHSQIAVNQAVYATKIEELTREVREHNGFARRMPVVENRLDTIEKKIDALEHTKQGVD